MIHDPDKLERLFSRRLDGECTPAEYDELDRRLREEPGVRAQFDEYRQLDRLVGAALRRDVRYPTRIIPLRPAWYHRGRGLLAVAAACVALLTWLQHSPKPPTPPPPRGTPAPHPVQASAAPVLPAKPASWFFTPAPHDAVAPAPSAYERPEVRLRGTQRDWIVIPGEQPGSYLIIEVDRVQTHVIGVHQDY